MSSKTKQLQRYSFMLERKDVWRSCAHLWKSFSSGSFQTPFDTVFFLAILCCRCFSALDCSRGCCHFPLLSGHSQRPQYRHRVVLEHIDEGWWFLWYASSDLLSLDWKSFGLAVVVTVVRVAFFIWFYFSTEGTLWVFLSETEVCLEVSLALE